MSNLLKTVAVSALLASSFAGAAHATDYISLNLGYYDIFRKDQKALQFGAEYRGNELGYGFAPIVGAFGTTDGSAYGYAGFNWNVPLIKNELYIVPNFAVGAYSEGGGKDLGGVLEFRSGIELDYQFHNGHQLGIALNHISNAGIYSHNPGEETVMATYSIPLHSVFGW